MTNTRTLGGYGLRTDIEQCPVAAQHVTLLLVARDGELRMGKSKGDKRSILANLEEGDQLLLAWTGTWSTDIFDVTSQADDIAAKL